MARHTADTFEARYRQSVRVRSGYLPQDPSAVLEWNDTFIDAVRSGTTPAPQWNSAVTDLATLLQNDPIIRMLVTEMILQEPDLYPRIKRKHVKDVDELLVLLDVVIRTAPVFGTETIPKVAFPMSTLLGFMMMTTAGEAVFRHATFNAAMLAILSEWCKFLESEDSLSVVTREKGNWLSKAAYQELHLEDYAIDSTEHGGFKCWNDFFRRQFTSIDTARPMDGKGDDAVIVAASDGAVRHITKGVKREDMFWVKGDHYSLRNMLVEPEYYDMFDGGDVIQTFLTGSDYHHFVSPIDGVIRAVLKIPGLLFSNAESAGYDPTGVKSLVYNATVNTRTLVLIDGPPRVGTVCVIPIGITEVSAITIGPKPGDKVAKGQELGAFSFGGSTLCTVFQKGKIKEFVVTTSTVLRARKKIATAHL